MKKLKSDRLHIVITPDEKTLLNEAAASVSLNLSAWVRMTLLKEARAMLANADGTKIRRT